MRHGGYGPFDDDDVKQDDEHAAPAEAFGGFSGFSGFNARVADDVVAPAPRARPVPRPGARPGARPRQDRSPAMVRPGHADRPDHRDHRDHRDQHGAAWRQPPRRAADAPPPHMAPPVNDVVRQPPPAPAPDLADPADHVDLADETLMGVARDLWRAGIAWGRSIHRLLLVQLAGVLVVLVLVMTLCASVFQASLHPTPSAMRSSLSSSSSSATTAPTMVSTMTSAATGGRFTGVVAVSYWAGHKEKFTASITVSATLSWATTTPAPFTCGNFTLTFAGYNRPQNITCQLTLPTGADGIDAEQFQNCVALHDANATTICWDNPARFWRA